ncbi:MAG: hypothetical protein Kow00124_02410 [Anaerolineae bacterium]
MTPRALTAALIVMAVAALAVGYASAVGAAAWLALIAAVGAAWLVGIGLRQDWASPAALLITAGLAANGITTDLPPGWMVTAMILAVSAWNADNFHRRIDGLPLSDRPALLRAFLIRLGAVAVLSGILAALTLGLELRLSFLAALILAALLVGALSRLVAALRRAADQQEP